jgi:translocation and assembly module TamA
MSVRLRARGRSVAFAVLLLLTGLAAPVQAFSLRGLFGGDDPPEPSRTALPYEVTFEVRGEDGVEGSLRDASNLYKLRQDAPPDGETLVARVEADFAPLIDALWGQGFYDARVIIDVAGVPWRSPATRPAARRGPPTRCAAAPASPFESRPKQAHCSGCAASRFWTVETASR